MGLNHVRKQLVILHQKDVHNYAAQGPKDGSMTTEEFEVELVATQGKELVAPKQACGVIDASQRTYDSFEKKCLGKLLGP